MKKKEEEAFKRKISRLNIRRIIYDVRYVMSFKPITHYVTCNLRKNLHDKFSAFVTAD